MEEKPVNATQFKEEQKALAIDCLEKLNIFKPYIYAFKKEDKVCFFERFGGYYVYQEKEIEAKMREIEKKYNCKVYAITHERLYGDEMWTFLLVSSYREDLEITLTKDGNMSYAFAYVWNKSYDLNSEFGTVAIQSFGGGIRRVG